jgi:hypothetical protein
VEIKIGDWFVTLGRWRVEALEAIKVTPKLVMYRSDGFEHQFQVRIEEVVFAGTKEKAERLAAQLTSSAARADNEKLSAQTRQVLRDRKLIEAAQS